MIDDTLFRKIATVLPTLDGWCELPKATDLASMVVAIRPNTVVEIGVFGGRSLIPCALALQAVGKGRIIGIDPWQAKISAGDYTGENADWWRTVDHEAIYQKFRSRVTELDLDSFVRVERKKSDDVEAPEVIDIFHLDGSHSAEQAVRDTKRFAPNVRVGGFVITDDDDWSDGGPAQAIKLLLKMGMVPLYKTGTGTVFQRVR